MIDSSLIVNYTQYTVTQDDLIIMEEESYHTILTIQKDKGPRTVTEEAVIEVEEVPEDPNHIPTLNRRPLRTSRLPSKFANYQKWD